MINIVRIKEFTVLKDFQFDFKNHSFLICGMNGIGKTSIHKFIKIALGDKSALAPGLSGEGDVFINRHGEEYHLKVVIENGKSKVTVTGSDGMRDSKKGVLANIFGAIDLNVNTFIELSRSTKGRKEQVEIFKSMLPKDAQDTLRKIEANIQTLYDERTENGKDVKRKEVEIGANPLGHLADKEVTNYQKIDVTTTMAEMRVMQDDNETRRQVGDRSDTRVRDINKQRDEIKKLKTTLAEAEEALKKDLEREKNATEWLKDPENQIKDISKHEEIINNATQTNEDYNSALKLMEDRKLLEKMISDHENYTIRIESERQEIEDAVKDMAGDLIPGLTYNEEGLIWNGLLVHPNTHSTGEQLELAMKLKMIENPDLQVLFLEHTESIDEDRMKRIVEIVNKEGWQLIGEEVRKNQKEITFELIGKQ